MFDVSKAINEISRNFHIILDPEHADGCEVPVLHRELHEAGLPVHVRHEARALLQDRGGPTLRGLDQGWGQHQVK